MGILSFKYFDLRYITFYKISATIISIFLFTLLYCLYYNEDFKGMPPTVDGHLTTADYFNRLYYSIILQTSVGFGDIVPLRTSLRMMSMIQALASMFLLIII